MKFGVNTFIWSEKFGPHSLELLPRIKEAGFDGMQVPLFRPKEFPAGQVRKAFEANGLECSVCALFVDGQSLISDDAAKRQQARQHIQDTIAASAEAGAKFVGGPLYCQVGYLPGRRRTADEWKWAIEGYQAAIPALQAHDMQFGIEPLNRFETFFLNTNADAAAICDAVGDPRVGVLCDTFHANIEEKDLGESMRKLGKHLKHLHTCENDRGIPGSGHVQWESMFLGLKDIGYDGWLTIESFGFEGALSAAVCIWRDIEQSPDAVAFEGVKFLRRAAAAA